MRSVALPDASEAEILVQLDSAFVELSNISTAAEAQFMLMGFSATRELAKRRGYSQAARVATEGRIRAGRRLGEFIPREFPHGNVTGDLTSSRRSLADIGVTYNQSSRYQKLASIADAVFERIVSEIDSEEESELSENAVLVRADRLARGRSVQHSESNEWYTPQIYVEAVRRVLGVIDLDPASSPLANETVKATSFFTVYDDGLAQPWIGRVFLNPPYGMLGQAFVQRLAEEVNDGNVTAAVVLVNAHCTDTRWFQPLWDGVLCFTDHRIDFSRPGSNSKTTSTHGSVFVYFGHEPERFANEFNIFGAVEQRFR